MSERTLEGLRLDIEQRIKLREPDGVYVPLTSALCEIELFAERFWQIVDRMAHKTVRVYYDDKSLDAYSDKCAPDCERCALEKIGGERR